MSFSASGFNRSRKTVDSGTIKSIHQILICIVNSYEKIITEGVIFDYSKRGTIKHEDYIRNRLVDDYLEKELNTLNDSTIDYTVNKEVTEEYQSFIDNKLHPDPIDIQIIIKDFSLKDSLTNDEGKTYFAIECKRLTTTVSEYINDIKKFTERNYIKRRLKIEGQIGFIENKSWDYSRVKWLLNQNLTNNMEINTLSNLTEYSIKSNFDGSYESIHLKKDNSKFKIYHLLLNYSDIA